MNLLPLQGMLSTFSRLCHFLPLVFALAACQSSASAAPLPVATAAFILVTSAPNPTVTPTPFQPAVNTPGALMPALILPSETPIPSPTFVPPTTVPYPTLAAAPVAPASGEYPTPQVQPSSIQIPPPVGVLSQPPNQVNILLLGSDQRPYSTIFRTDTMILATINKDKGSINLTAIPRDLYVYIPGWTMQRINTAMAHGGFEQLALTFEYNLGVRPDYFAMVNFRDFIAIVDSLGGIDVQAAQPLYDTRTSYGWFYVPTGPVHMDGEMALWYVRSRSTSNDIDRLRRAEEVMVAIGSRLMTFDALTRIPDFYNLYKDKVTTNVSLEDVLALAPVAQQASQNNRVQSFVIGYGPLYDWTEPFTGAMVLLPNRDQVLALMSQALNSP
jgi:LCP family protein required for cell wall assembly